MNLESDYQRKLKRKITHMLPNSMVFKMDSQQLQGVPDLLVINGSKWAALEVKQSKNAKHRPNQDYWVKRFNEMSYAAFIFPENEKEVLEELYEVLS